jgi:hypothetical protein
MSRYVLVAFPGFMLLGLLPKAERWFVPLVALSLMVQTVLFSQLLEWIFVG